MALTFKKQLAQTHHCDGLSWVSQSHASISDLTCNWKKMHHSAKPGLILRGGGVRTGTGTGTAAGAKAPTAAAFQRDGVKEKDDAVSEVDIKT